MSSVTFSTTVGGDGSTVTDDDDATTGLRNGGWRTRFVPALAQEVAVAANAVASATAALSSKNAAAASASTATTQASNASTSATNAANSATAAAASYDSFDDRYLGVKTSDPSVDNDGNALLVGALYWNSATSVFKVWSGSVWITNLTSNQFGTNVATFLQTPSSANLAAALTDETGTGSAVFANAPTFPAQINLTANSGYNIYASGTADNYLAGSLGIGVAPSAGQNLVIYKNLTGASTSYGIISTGIIQSDVTAAQGIRSALSTAAATFTVADLYQYVASQGTFGAGSSVTNQYGFHAALSLTGATNNYGFYGGIASGTGRYNLYMAGSAENFFGGKTVVSVTDNTDAALRITQLGTGNALLVEDSANPDSSPFVIDQNGINIQGHTSAITFVNPANGTMSNVLKATVGNSSSQLHDAQAIYAPTNTTVAAPYKIFARSNTLTVGSQVAVSNGDLIGGNSWQASDGSNFVQTASITAFVDGTPGTNDMPGRLVFSTTADGASSPTERMRIDSTGNVGIGTSSPNASAILDAQSTTKGVRFPNMTTTQKNAVATPAAGLVVFDTTLSKLCVYSGAAWQTITSI